MSDDCNHGCTCGPDDACVCAEFCPCSNTIATLRTRLAAAEAERDVLRDECASISKEFGLPPGIRPAEGEIARMMGRARRTEQAEAEVARLRATVENMQADERIAADWRAHVGEWEANKIAQAREAEAEREAEEDKRREWEVRAATSYRDGRWAALREAAGKAALVAREYEWKAQQVEDDSDRADGEAQDDDVEWLSTCASIATRIERRILSLLDAAPAAEVEP